MNTDALISLFQVLKQECALRESVSDAKGDHLESLQEQLSASEVRKQSLLQQISGLEEEIIGKEKMLKKAK